MATPKRMRKCRECNESFMGEIGENSYFWCKNCLLIKLLCENCNKEFLIQRIVFNHRGAKFCSLKCSKEKTLFTHEKISKEKHPKWKGGFDIKKYRQENRDKKIFWELRRLNRKKGNGGSHTLEQWQELKREYDYMCLCCKKCEPDIKLTEDHIVPTSKGGNDGISNIQPLCLSCNSRKNARTVDYRFPLISQEYELQR